MHRIISGPASHKSFSEFPLRDGRIHLRGDAERGRPAAIHHHGRTQPPAWRRRRGSPPNPDAGVELLSVGTVIPGVEITIRDDNHAVLPDRVVGEVCVRSNCLFDGYYRLPEETALRLAGDLYHTRDRGFFLDGELYVLGRMDDLVIVGGRNFHATEIENILNTVKGLKPGRKVVFGLPNTERGTNDLIAVAETYTDTDTDPTSPGHRALRHDVRHAIFQALGMYPAEVKLVPQGWLLKTPSGKIERGRNALKYQDTKSLVGAA